MRLHKVLIVDNQRTLSFYKLGPYGKPRDKPFLVVQRGFIQYHEVLKLLSSLNIEVRTCPRPK